MTAGTAGFTVILVLYATIGVLAAIGSVVISQKLFQGRAERTFYGIFLIPIAGFYLAFAAYFGIGSSWKTELAGVLAFSALGFLGTRNTVILILGYSLHGVWDILHEVRAHTGLFIPRPAALTGIPMGYGVFCLLFDAAISVYFVRRRKFWSG